jgi:EcsC protein family
MSPEDLKSLRRAVLTLEHPSLAARLTNIVGKPVDLLGQALPPSAAQVIAKATSKGLEVAVKVAMKTMAPRSRSGSKGFHTALASASGAVGGAFGFTALPIELPVSTIIMLRAIANIARSEGEDLSDPETALSCVQVFALGTRSGSSTDILESSYFTVRGMLAKTLTEAARFVAERGVIKGGPALVRFIAQVASRFGLVVTQKVAAQALPVLGALGGAAVNYAFVQHFQEVARGHFTVRRLERIYGKDLVRAEYERIMRNDESDSRRQPTSSIAMLSSDS